MILLECDDKSGSMVDGIKESSNGGWDFYERMSSDQLRASPDDHRAVRILMREVDDCE